MGSVRVLVILACCFTTVVSTETQGCLSSNCCPGQIELFPGDTVTLETNSDSVNGGWCGHQFLVRNTKEGQDLCGGCTMNVKFVDYSTPFNATVELLQASYNQGSFYGSSFINLQSMAKYGVGTEATLPASVNTTGTILQISFSNTEKFTGKLKMVVSSNTPVESISTMLAILIVVGVLVVVVPVLIVVVVVKRRRRRLAHMRGNVLIANFMY